MKIKNPRVSTCASFGKLRTLSKQGDLRSLVFNIRGSVDGELNIQTYIVLVMAPLCLYLMIARSTTVAY